MDILVDKEYRNQIVESKSKFIAILVPIIQKDDYIKVLDNVKKEFDDASHYCYAMRYKGFAKCSDDKEPSGTAGRPILVSLERKNIDCAVLIVVRYFGGTKLGAGRLLRMYVKSASSVIDKFLKR